MSDPQLRLLDGGCVPFIKPFIKAYKHLGNMRRADGSDAAGWTALKMKLRSYGWHWRDCDVCGVRQ